MYLNISGLKLALATLTKPASQEFELNPRCFDNLDFARQLAQTYNTIVGSKSEYTSAINLIVDAIFAASKIISLNKVLTILELLNDRLGTIGVFIVTGDNKVIFEPTTFSMADLLQTIIGLNQLIYVKFNALDISWTYKTPQQNILTLAQEIQKNLSLWNNIPKVINSTLNSKTLQAENQTARASQSKRHRL
jgi:hypothetical protein